MHSTAFLASALTALLLTGCASTNVATRTTNQVVSDSSSVEAGMWHKSDKLEQKLNMSAAVIDDMKMLTL